MPRLPPPPPPPSYPAASGITHAFPDRQGTLLRAADIRQADWLTNPAFPLSGEWMAGIAVTGLALAAAAIYAVCRRRRKTRPVTPGSFAGIALGWHKTFDYEELKRATADFSDSNLLGEGGFGLVYKGILPSGEVVAIKQLRPGSRQGEREFRAEVSIISRIHHRHLVSLVGYCVADTQRFLVYEFVPNRTLDVHLYGTDRPVMSWSRRMQVGLGSARGLAYLHEECNPSVIHRDIKSSNILLDSDFEAKVADFGLAKFIDTPLSTRVMGTFGYMDPEYFMTGKLTEKVDVYSFGVVLAELLTGRKAVDCDRPEDQHSLVEWARPLLGELAIHELIDPHLDNHYSEAEVRRVVRAASLCIQRNPDSRPRMSQVVRILEGDTDVDENYDIGSHGGGFRDEQQNPSGPLLTGESSLRERDTAKSIPFDDDL